jgi:hypothetical protein
LKKIQCCCPRGSGYVCFDISYSRQERKVEIGVCEIFRVVWAMGIHVVGTVDGIICGGPGDRPST